jgi:hypothetical protein
MDQALAERLEDFWRQLHRLWGLNSSGLYDKQGWHAFATDARELLKDAGLERRRAERLEAIAGGRMLKMPDTGHRRRRDD